MTLRNFKCWLIYDPKFYPGKYQLWRFRLEIIDNCGTEAKYKKEGGCAEWKPCHSVTDREQLIINAKLGQKINMIIWSRWPNATIDYCDPEAPPAVV